MAASPSSTCEEAQQLRGVHDGQQIVDLEGQVVGQAVDVVAAALVEQQFEQAGDAAGPRVGQHLVVHLALVAHGAAGLLVRALRPGLTSGRVSTL